MSAYHAAVEVLTNCGFEQRWTEGQMHYYGNRYTWFCYDANATGSGRFEVIEPPSWPGLQDVVSVGRMWALGESKAGEVGAEDLCVYLGGLRAQARSHGLPASSVFRALAMFHEQYRMLSMMNADVASGEYAYADCLPFAATDVDLDDLRRLVRLQLSKDLMRQACAGEIAASLMLQLYDPKNVTVLS